MRWIMIAIAAAFLLSTFLMYDSGRRGRPAPSDDGTTQDYAVATVNGQDIMRSALETMVRNYIQQANIREITSADVPLLYKSALDNAIFLSELEKEVSARNVTVTEAEITAQVNGMADSFPTREAFAQYIERSGIKMDDLRKDVKHQLSTNKTIDLAIGDQPVSDDAVREFYDMTKAIFFTQPKGFMFDIADLVSKMSASVLRAKMAMNSSEWAEVLSSDIPSVDIIRKTDEPTFMSEAFLSEDEKMRPLLTVKIGEVGPVIEMSSVDYMVAVKRENIDGKEAAFDEVSGEIKMMLKEQQTRTAYDNFSKELVNRANIVIHDHAIFPAPAQPASGDVK